MARCCGGATCACKVSAGTRATVTGTGTSQDPFVISADVALAVAQGTSFITLVLSGAGTAASPWSIKADWSATAKLANIPDVNAPAPTNGQVLSYNTATSKWVPAAPTTAASGSVQHDTSLTGDGSAGTPLAVSPNATRYVATSASGVGLNDAGINQMVRKFADASSRSAASPAPALNSLSMLDTVPGRVDYWTGVAWEQVKTGTTFTVSGGPLLVMSGGYTAGVPLTLLTKQVSIATDAIGEFEILTASDLSGAGGVLSATFQEGSIGLGWSATLIGNVDKIVGTAYRLDNGQPLAAQTVIGTVVAYIY